jgi:hypothetical protein
LNPAMIENNGDNNHSQLRHNIFWTSLLDKGIMRDASYEVS